MRFLSMNSFIARERLNWRICSYSVLSLGDTSYEFFCQTGKDFDKRLEELGGKRLAPRVDCDVDFDEPAAEWMNSVLGSLSACISARQRQLSAGAAGSCEWDGIGIFKNESV